MQLLIFRIFGVEEHRATCQALLLSQFHGFPTGYSKCRNPVEIHYKYCDFHYHMKKSEWNAYHLHDDFSAKDKRDCYYWEHPELEVPADVLDHRRDVAEGRGEERAAAWELHYRNIYKRRYGIISDKKHEDWEKELEEIIRGQYELEITGPVYIGAVDFSEQGDEVVE